MVAKPIQERTSTRSFGGGSRLGHDASAFYSRKIYQVQGNAGTARDAEIEIPSDILNQVYCCSSESMQELPDGSVHLMVTSPPYNVGKEYDEDLTLVEYTELLRSVFTETYRVLADGARACVNVANIGRKPYIPLNGLVASLMIDIGFLMRGEIIWNKAASAGTSCAWGSWRSPSNPVLRDVHEYILVFSKQTFGRSKGNKTPTISRDDFLSDTKSIWSFPAASAKKYRHPAPFPIELPRRLINLYTFEEDVVLDPFMGSGSTALAAVATNRQWVGYDTSSEYCDLTRERVSELKQ